MNNNISYFRIYDEKLDLLYETGVKTDNESKPSKLDQYLRKSELFLNVGNIACYRIVPEVNRDI